MHLWVTPRGMRGESDTGLSPSVRWVDSGRTRWPLRNLLISRDLVTTQDNPLCLVPMPGPATWPLSARLLAAPQATKSVSGKICWFYSCFSFRLSLTPPLTPQYPFSWLWPLESQTTCAPPSQAALGQPCRDGKMQPSPGSTPFPPQMQFSVPTWIWLTFPKSIPGRRLIEAHRTVPSFVLGTLLLRM